MVGRPHWAASRRRFSDRKLAPSNLGRRHSCSSDSINVVGDFHSTQKRLTNSNALKAIEPKVLRMRCVNAWRGADWSAVWRQHTFKKILIAILAEIDGAIVGSAVA